MRFVNSQRMNNADYHRHPAVSKSHLDQIARSPLHYWSRYLDPDRVPPEPSTAMTIGSALHMHVLELDQWDANYVVMPEGLKRTTKEGKAAYEALLDSGKTILSHSDAAAVQAMGRSIFGHPAAATLLKQDGKPEQTFMWTDQATGVECKCRPDYLTADGSMIVDLKTTKDAGRGFQRSIGEYRYHVQAAWYLHGVEQATGVRPEFFVFIAVESSAPYATAVYVADEQMIAIGWETAQRDLAKLAECKAAGQWPSYSNEIERISLPPWMRPKADGTAPTITEIETF